ncbi:MAG: amidohydrolase/deacetylase family metallohydrolase [Daejeonella sp.]|uniref:amidohydrolase/deacetylase family metallohydrolase n=1 Tax=Daejeonella sp. TaxID=2805397 RepID=UPI0027356348|nr:amidohydrolase/deacetylase family metallohydrolase [Daejeonella sp.]MDP3466733.1 amidohydrolase/deacetylase family metallohydrolase [Daejeonella sp.]
MNSKIVRISTPFLTGILLSISTILYAQTYDILLKGGHLIDPKNKINEKMDLAINQGKVVRVAADIPASSAKKVIDVNGLYVTPGLIDIHVHVFAGTKKEQQYMDGPNSLPPDGFTFRAGVTTVVDAGSAGWRSFPLFKKNIIDQSKTRVLAFLNIVGDGMGANEQDSTDMSPIMASRFADYFKKDIVGFKVAHYNGLQSIPVDSAVKAGRLSNMPVMIDWRGLPPSNSLENLLMKHLRPGDILTHMYHAGKRSPVAPFYKEALVDPNGRVNQYVINAQKRGVIFDVGHGGNGFVYSQAMPSLKQGLYPNSISSDLHTGNMNAGMKDMNNIMAKFLNMGMSLHDVILMSTWNPAQYIKRPELGHLSVGSEADIAVLNLKNDDFGFIDSHGFVLKGTQKLETELTLRAGKIEWDLNGRGATKIESK